MVNGGSDGAAVALDVADVDKNDTKKRRFLRGLRRMFRRRGQRDASDGSRDNSGGPEAREPPAHTPTTQRLIAIEDGHRRKSTSVHQSGLSVSHDSVFTAEASGASGGESDEERARSSSSTSERRRRHHHHHHHHNYHGGGGPLNAELAAAVRRRARGDTSEEDEDLGLPRSPPASPPKRGNGVNGVGGVRDQSSCSEGSLLSAGSSQSEDDCRSSRGDLTHSTFDSSDVDGQESLGGLAPLSHSAAKHKMAIKPRRTHGAPRRNRPKQISPASVLPTTPEVNEDAARSVTPEVNITHKSNTDMSTPTMPSDRHNIMITSSYEMNESISHSERSADLLLGHVSKETKLKSSSLPPGLALSQMMGQVVSSPMKLSVSSSEELGNAVKVGRSKSNAQKKGDTDDQKMIHELQSSSERNLSSFSVLTNQSISYKSMDTKYSSVVSGELQKKFGSVSEDEELLNSGNFESVQADIKNKPSCDKIEKTDKYNDTHSFEIISKNKHLESDEHSEKNSSKKEESFFNRLLLRRSGKKGKKEISDKDEQIDASRKHFMKEQHPVKSASSDQIATGKTLSDSGVVRHQKMMCSDQHAHKSIGQKVFSNESHKRIDPRGGYVQDPMTKSSIEFRTNETSHFVDKEFSRSKEDINLRRLSSENSNKTQSQQSKSRQRVEPLDIPVSPDQLKKPPLLPRTAPHEQKSLFPSINQGKVYPSKEVVNGGRYMKNTAKHFNYTEDNSQTTSPKIKNKSDNMFGISQVVKQTESIVKPLSYSVSPPKSVWPHNYNANSEFKSSSQGSLDIQGMRHSKSDYNTRYFDYPNQMRQDYDMESSKSRPKIAGLSSYQQKITQMGNLDNDSDASFHDSGSVRNPVIKSHSFRHNSDIVPMVSQDLPSLPPMYGISESSMDSWESTYKKNIRDVSDGPSSLELGSDSLMNYSYKNDINRNFTETGVFVVPSVLALKEVNDIICDSTKAIKVQDDISRIEANIDSIIGNSKPLTCIALKSSSLDSVQSFTEKEQGRKAYSNESISHNKVYLNQSTIPDVVGSVSFSPKLSPEANKTVTETVRSKSSIDLSSTGSQIPESHISVTVFNSPESNLFIPPLRTPELMKTTTQHFDFTFQSNADKTSQKQQQLQKDTKVVEKSLTTSSVPEFMKIQLNKVDQKPLSNVVLSTGSSNESKIKTPTKTDTNFTIGSQHNIKKPDAIERSMSYEPKKSDKYSTDVKKSDSSEKIIVEEVKEANKPIRKFSSEDVEILEKSEINIQNNSYNIQLKKAGSQTLLHKSTEALNVDTSVQNPSKPEEKVVVPTSLNLRKSPSSVSNLPPPSPTAHKSFVKKKSGAFDFIENNNDVNKRQSTPIMGIELRTAELNLIEKNSVAQSIKRMSSHELLGVDHNPRIDRSSSSSDDCNLESTVIFRKKSISSIGQRSSTTKDDEPELMKVFARRSLKLKDSETESITQDIMKLANVDQENNENGGDEGRRNSKHDFNIMTRSRDSDKENETDSPKDERKKSLSSEFNKNVIEYRKHNNETAELMQAQRMPKKLLDLNPNSVNNASNVQSPKPTPVISYSGYQRSISTNIPITQTVNSNNKIEVTNNKPENTNNKSDVANYKKDVSDSTPEKRYRNRTFPDSSNENKVDESIKSVTTKTEQYNVGTSSLPKKPWGQMKSEESVGTKDILKPLRKSSFGVITPEAKPIAANNKTVLEKFPINKSISEKNVPMIGSKSIIPDKNVPSKGSDDKLNSNNQDGEVKKSNTSVESIQIENNKNINEADASPQFKGILQMRAEWERRAQQAMTK